MKEITFEDIDRVNKTLSTTDIKGKDYIQVNQRIKAFRMLYPNGAITTELLQNENGICVFKATIIDENGKVLATGTAYEKENNSFINKTSYIENCETSAVGRALGMVGFGIDTSIASAEEVGNAITQQESNESDEIIPPKMVDALDQAIANNNINETAVLSVLMKYGYKSTSEIQKKNYMAIVNELKGEK